MKERIFDWGRTADPLPFEREPTGAKTQRCFCDMTRPLGTFLINFERDTDRDWNLYGLSPLRQALYPLITYYLNRLNDWGLWFRRTTGCGKYFTYWLKEAFASGGILSCAATIAEKHRRFKTSGNLTRGQEKITMTCFIKMNARTGAIRSTKRRGQRDSRLTSWKKC